MYVHLYHHSHSHFWFRERKQMWAEEEEENENTSSSLVVEEEKRLVELGNRELGWERERERVRMLELVHYSMCSLPPLSILLYRFRVSSIPKHAKTQHFILHYINIPPFHVHSPSFFLFLFSLSQNQINTTILKNQSKHCNVYPIPVVN